MKNATATCDNRRDLTNLYRQVAAELLQGFIREINTYIGIVLKGMEEDLGRCGPLSNVYKSVLVAGCNRVVDPFVS